MICAACGQGECSCHEMLTLSNGVTVHSDCLDKLLTEEQLVAGLSEARRIINQSAGYYFGGELIPFDKAFKSIALRTITQLEAKL